MHDDITHYAHLFSVSILLCPERKIIFQFIVTSVILLMIKAFRIVFTDIFSKGFFFPISKKMVKATCIALKFLSKIIVVCRELLVHPFDKHTDEQR